VPQAKRRTSRKSARTRSRTKQQAPKAAAKPREQQAAHGREWDPASETEVMGWDEAQRLAEAALEGVESALHGLPAGEALESSAAAELDALERQVAEMRPLAELGEISAVIAHEIRNPLAGIAATAEVLRDSFGPADERRESVEVILQEAGRLERVARNLLSLACNRKARLLPTDPAEDVERAARAIAADADHAGVVLRVEHPETCTPVLVDSELIQQAYVNLAANAILAMPQGGTLSIRTCEPDVNSEFVCVEFADSGCGIRPEHLPRIFDTFFSTRSEGAGLGLAVARKLIEHQRGHIAVESEPGQGTTFTVYLRRADAAACDTPSPDRSPARGARATANGSAASGRSGTRSL
jgi:signal transduction histidine kinase